MNAHLKTALLVSGRVGRMSVALSAVCVVPCVFLIRRITACGLIRPTALCAFGLIAATPANAGELGRLFFTPEQRTMLERGQQPDIENPDNPDQPAIAESLTVSGIVQRHGGERTVWINGVPQIAGKSDERAPESVPVAIPGQAQPVRVKVGQEVLLNPPVLQKTEKRNPTESGDD